MKCLRSRSWFVFQTSESSIKTIWEEKKTVTWSRPVHICNLSGWFTGDTVQVYMIRKLGFRKNGGKIPTSLGSLSSCSFNIKEFSFEMDKINQTFCHIFCRAVYEHYPKYFQNKSLLKGTVRFIGCLLITSSQRVIKRIFNPNSQNTLLYISCYIRCVCVYVCVLTSRQLSLSSALTRDSSCLPSSSFLLIFPLQVHSTVSITAQKHPAMEATSTDRCRSQADKQDWR